jgi:hypothetical protein
MIFILQNLKKSNVSLDLKNSTPEERSNSAKAMADPLLKILEVDVAATIEGKESFILDGTGASYNATVKLKNELEEVGYDVLMLYVYTDLERSLSQNQDRYEKSDGEDRSLAPAIVMRTWKNVTDNLPKYANLFGFNFAAVANTLEGQRIQDIDKIIDKYLKPFKPEGTKPKSPAQQKNSDERKAIEKKEIQAMLDDEFIYDVIEYTMSKNEAQTRINKFLR